MTNSFPSLYFPTSNERSGSVTVRNLGLTESQYYSYLASDHFPKLTIIGLKI